jgi:hypothetical protein
MNEYRSSCDGCNQTFSVRRARECAKKVVSGRAAQTALSMFGLPMSMSSPTGRFKDSAKVLAAREREKQKT